MRIAVALVCLLASAPALAQQQQPQPQSQPTPTTSPDTSIPPVPTEATKQVAPEDESPKFSLEIYGFVWFAGGYDFDRIDPLWYDVERPTKIESSPGEFGDHGETFMSVRPSRFGAKGELPTRYGTLKTIFEFELFGTGVDAGQTTFRLRHFYGELGAFGAGQYWSVFMDPDVFPNSLEYWGPNGMVFFRNIQVRWMPLRGPLHVTVALERPGASADTGDFSDLPELMDVTSHFPVPDLTAEVRYGNDETWGHVKLAGIVRDVAWSQNNVTPGGIDLSGSVTGWGVMGSAVLKFSLVTLKLQLVYGEAIENYMNDAGVDVAPQNNPGDPTRPFTGKALPVFGLVAFADLAWSDRFASSVGFSYVHVDNADGQAANTFRNGYYGLANFLWTPIPDLMVGVEGQWGRRDNFNDGFSANDFRIQLTGKFSFSAFMGRKKSEK